MLKKEVPEVDQLLTELAEIIRPLVLLIEASDPVTKGHYDKYMGLIAMMQQRFRQEHSNTFALAIGVALKRAGANKAGVTGALYAMGAIPSLEA